MCWYCVFAFLTIRFRDTFDFILFLDCIRVGTSSCSINQFFRQTFSSRLEVTKGRFSRTGRQEIERIIDAAKGTHVHGLATHHTGASHARGIFARSGIDNGVHHHLNGVLVRQEMNDFERVLHDAAGHHFLSRVAALAHQATGQSFHNGAGGLAKSFHLVATGSVWQKDGVISLASNVIHKRNITNFNIIKTPLSKQFYFRRSTNTNVFIFFGIFWFFFLLYSFFYFFFFFFLLTGSVVVVFFFVCHGCCI
mmetsp:Transcript_26974/g.41362  ORF Transcript_26974/g.41362 Transcript_26974/m.41362 type:complete len:251 (+) Transcript_26974:455-1207(+)